MPKAQMHHREIGAGYPVLLIRGFNGNLSDRRFQIPAPQGEFRAISIDQRGHAAASW